MKLPLFRKPQTSALNEVGDNLPILRERIVSILLICAITLGAVAYVVSVQLAIELKTWWTIGLNSVIYGWIIIITVFPRRFSYRVRATSILAILYWLGLFNLLENGLTADGGVFLLAFTLLGSLFFGMQGGITALLLSMVSFGAVGGLMIVGTLRPPPAPTSSTNPTDWISGWTVFLLLGATAVTALGTIMRGLENSINRAHKLTADLEIDREQLNQRQKELQRRLTQIRAAAEIGRTTSGILNPQQLLEQAVELVRARFDLYFAGIYLIEINERSKIETAVLRAGTGEAGKALLAENHSLPINRSSPVGWAISERRPRIALDIGSDAIHFDYHYLPQTRSELAFPLIGGQQILGAMTVLSTQGKAYDQDDVIVLQGIADSLAITLGNARLFHQVQTNLEEIRKLNRQYMATAWADTGRGSQALNYTFEQPELEIEAGPSYSTQVPLTLRDQVIGQITLDSEHASWSPEELAFIEAVTTQATLALENARLVEETQSRAAHERFVVDLARQARSSSDIEVILRTAIRELGRELNVSEGLIWLSGAEQDSDQKHSPPVFSTEPDYPSITGSES